jgi:hypothetical protein
MKTLSEIVEEIGKKNGDGANVSECCVTFYNQGGYDSISLTFDEILQLAEAIKTEGKP